MGITQLKKLIGKSGQTKHLSAYRGKRIAVDASIWLYNFIYRDEENAVVDGFLRQLRQFHTYQITPVYVFDGKASAEVKIEIERRQDRRERVTNAIDTLSVELSETLEYLGDTDAAAAVTILDQGVTGNIAKVDIPFDIPMFIPDSDDEEEGVPRISAIASLQQRAVELKSRISSLQKQTRRPTRDVVEQCKELLTIVGLQFIQAPGESDVTLAELIATGVVDGVMSEDTDMLPYGCHTFITGFKSQSDEVVEFKLDRVLADLKLTREQFVDFCILCGCDYAEKIYKIGVKKGYELIVEHGNIEKILEHIQASPVLIKRHPYPEDFMCGVNVARNMFLTRGPCTEETDAQSARTISQLTLEPVSPYRWNFKIAAVETLKTFLATHQIPERFWSVNCKLCSDWSTTPVQKSMLEYLQ